MNSNSVQTIKNTPQSEPLFLSRNGWLSISVVTLLMFKPLISFSEGIKLMGFSLSNLIDSFALINFIFLIVMLVKVFKSARLLSGSSYWFGYLEDEFLEHINNKGYKYGFITLIIFTSFITFGYDAFLSDFEGLTVSIIGSFCVSIGCFTYGITVLSYLKASDDE
jgi:hypothetical protein